MTETPVEVRIRELERTITRLESMVDTGDQLINAQLNVLKSELAALKVELVERVHIDRYIVVERIVFGLVAITLVTVIGAILALVLQGGNL